MSEENQQTPEVNDIKVEEVSTDVKEEVPEVVVEEPVKPKRKSRKAAPPAEVVEEPVKAEPVKAKTTKKKKEKVEVVAVELEQQPAEPEAPAPTPEPETPRVNHADFKSVQQGMANLQAEFRRLRREQKSTHYRKLLEGKI